MECGKIKSDGLPIFYFVIDPLTPEKPSASRVRTYYVVTHVDSYVEAFYFIARHFSTPAASLDEAIQRWHALYTRVFGTASLESFRKSLLGVPVEHFALAPTEDAARERAVSHIRSDRMDSVVDQRDRSRRVNTSAYPVDASTRAADAESKRVSPSRQRRAVSPMLDDDQPEASAIPFAASTAEARTLFRDHERERARSRATNLEAADRIERSATASRVMHEAQREAASTTMRGTGGVPARDDADYRRGGTLNASGVLTGAPLYREDAKVELHRLRAEHPEPPASAAASMDVTRAKVMALSEAERAALIYQVNEARREATHDKAVAKEASERLRAMSKSLEDRVETLVANHEQTLRERSAAEHKRLTDLEEDFLEREKSMQREYETAIHDRERRLNRAISRVKAYETHLEDALQRVESQKVKIQEATSKIAEGDNERQTLEEENRRLQRQVHALEIQAEDANRQASLAEDAQRRSEQEAAELRIEVSRYKREVERYSYFSHSLHRELQQLDDSAITAAELLRRKVHMSRTSSFSDPQQQQQQ